MPEPTLADLFAEARTLLDGKTVGCTGHPGASQQECVACRGSDPGPAYDALRDVTKRMVEYWQRAPDKALEGALIGALYPLRDQGADGLRDRLLSMVESRLIGEQGDTRIPAMQAVVEWLKVANA